jgi:hypothetical protein
MDSKLKTNIDENLATLLDKIQDNELTYDNFPLLKGNPFINSVIFNSSYEKFTEIIDNIYHTKRSDILISYGNNSFVSRIFIQERLKELYGEDDYEREHFTIINFNAYIHSTEDYIFRKICKELDIEIEKSGFDSSHKALENYYKNESQVDKFVVIYFENIEYLFIKKKQILLYTILEILNISQYILLCGTTNNFNFLELMEKRVRSRFSQKTVFLTLDSYENVFNALDRIFRTTNSVTVKKSKKGNAQLQPDIREIFYDNLLQTEIFVKVITKYIDLGLGIREIITKIKYILTLITLELNKFTPKDQESLFQLLIKVLSQYHVEESKDSYLNLLKSKERL